MWVAQKMLKNSQVHVHTAKEKISITKKMPDIFFSQHLQTGVFLFCFVFVNLYLLFRIKTSDTYRHTC